jgi:hypothetical protein
MSHMLATTIEPLYILEEHIAAEAVTLRAKHNSKGGFTFSTNSKDSPSKVLYAADSRSGLGAPRRLIKDAAGEGILELWRNATGHDSYIGRPKGAASPPLAVIAPRKTVSKDKVDVYVKKAAGAGLQRGTEARGSRPRHLETQHGGLQRQRYRDAAEVRELYHVICALLEQPVGRCSGRRLRSVFDKCLSWLVLPVAIHPSSDLRYSIGLRYFCLPGNYSV